MGEAAASPPSPAAELAARLSRPLTLMWLAGLSATFALMIYGAQIAPWTLKYPRAWQFPIKTEISRFMKWLVNDATFGLFTFKELTRSLAWVLERPLELATSLLSTGFLQGQGSDAVQILPPLTWIAVIAVLLAMGHYARDWKLAALVAGCFIYLAVFGQWDSAMVTLSSIVIAVPFGVAGGLLIGIQAYRRAWFAKAVTPLLDLMQTVPIFAYLVPILFLFGFGPVAAMIATIIYAMPPMVRVTMLALHQVPSELTDFGRMAGCTARQMLWKVLVPSAMPSLMVGVNQVIMLSLNMVIIASMIGAGGLGFEVLTSLKRLDIGKGVEAGIAIVVLAIALDRLSQAYAHRSPPPHVDAASMSWPRRHPHTSVALVVILVTGLLGLLLPAVQDYPKALHITTGSYWGDLVTYINVNFFDQLDAVKSFRAAGPGRLAAGRLASGAPGGRALPLRGDHRAMAKSDDLGLPGGRLGDDRLPDRHPHRHPGGGERAGRAGGPGGHRHPADPAVIRLSDPGGDAVPSGRLFRHDRGGRLCPGAGDPLHRPIRYTAHGIRQISPQLIEAGIAAGCTRRQLLWKVKLKLALPEIMLGVNQTIMLALSMLVITALVGTRDLGQEVYIALTKADTGRGIVAGVSVAFIAIIADRLIAAWAYRRKRELGLS
jgi:glycine betaine/proline transport system permease protein